MADLRTVLRRVAVALIPAYAALLLLFALPILPLDGGLARAAYWVAEAGDTLGATLLSTALVAVIVLARPGVAAARRVGDALLLGMTATLVFGGGAWVNEHGIKPWFGVPRPSILELEAVGTLKMDAGDFYGLGGKVERTAYLAQRLVADDYVGPALAADVRDHWSRMTGYSFPSGHSFSSMMIATFFLATALASLPRSRSWPFYFLVPWAVAVCASRVVLRVHSPLDVCVGAAQGIAVGLLAFLFVRALLDRGSESASLVG